MHKWMFAVALLHIVVLMQMVCQASKIPDQSGFEALEEMRSNHQAVVRVYSAPVPYLRSIATHAWFAIKSADETTFERWEVWQTAGGPYGHVQRDLMRADSDVGAGGVFVVAEIVGAEAIPIVEFIRRESPTYPCRNQYWLLGPNSNTYPQWVLDQVGWNVRLPTTAIGKDAGCGS